MCRLIGAARLTRRAVCIAVVNKVKDATPKNKQNDEKAVEDALFNYCKTATGKDERFVCRPMRMMWILIGCSAGGLARPRRARRIW